MRAESKHLIWILLAYSIGLWWYTVPFTGDAKVYISTAMEMWMHGADWGHPRLFGETSYFKPPLQYWATLLGWTIFGFNPFGTLFPSVAALLATAWALDRIARELAVGSPDASRPRVAGLFFAGCAGTMTFGLSAQMEIWVVAFYATAWWASLKFCRDLERARASSSAQAPTPIQWRTLYLALAITGIAALVKSPLYSAFWVLGFWIYLVLTRRLTLLKRRHFYGAHLFGVALGLVWFIYVYLTDGPRFWNHYVVQETLSKRNGNGSSILRMFGDFSTFVVPWLLLLLIPAARAVLGRASPSDTLERERRALLLGWLLVPTAFFTYFPYRTETYLYPILPALALVLDWYARPMSRAERVLSRINGVLLGLVLVAVALLLQLGGLIPLAVFLLCALAALAFAWTSWKHQLRAIALACVGVIFALRMASTALGSFDLAGLHEILAASAAAPTAASSPPSIVYLDEGRHIWHEVGLLSTATGQPSRRVTSADEAAVALESGSLLILNDTQWPEFLPRLQERLGPRAQSLEVQSWMRLKRAFQVPKLSDIRAASQSKREYKVIRLITR
jgi:4-amino-4-deoxy-L-arabinose transferase-like glycosyltransferase